MDVISDVIRGVPMGSHGFSGVVRDYLIIPWGSHGCPGGFSWNNPRVLIDVHGVLMIPMGFSRFPWGVPHVMDMIRMGYVADFTVLMGVIRMSIMEQR